MSETQGWIIFVLVVVWLTSRIFVAYRHWTNSGNIDAIRVTLWRMELEQRAARTPAEKERVSQDYKTNHLMRQAREMEVKTNE